MLEALLALFAFVEFVEFFAIIPSFLRRLLCMKQYCAWQRADTILPTPEIQGLSLFSKTIIMSIWLYISVKSNIVAPDSMAKNSVIIHKISQNYI